MPLSALTWPVVPRSPYSRRFLARAMAAPSQRRRSAERPTFRWSAARPAIGPTRSSRLGGASAISFKRYSPWGRTMELGRSRRTLLMMLLLRPPRRRARAGFISYGVIRHARLAHPSSLSIGARADPATSIISRATRSGRRPLVLAESGSGRTLELGRSRRPLMMMLHRPRGSATGSSPTRGIERPAV